MTVYDLAVIKILAVAVIFAVVLAVRRKKNGRSCCGDCSRCNKCK